MTEPLVLFRVGAAMHALRASEIVRAVRSAAVTPIPRAPGPLLGVLDVGGSILPVLSIRRRLGMPDEPVGLEEHFLIARIGSRVVVLAVDEALGVVETASIARSHELVPGLEGFEGLARLEDGIVLIHDLAAFLSSDGWRLLDTLVANAGSP